MKKNKKFLGAILAGALSVSAASTLAQAEAEHATGAGVECYGINSCKGKGACGGKDHSCAGLNACKGRGYIEVATKEKCLEKKGSLTPLPAKKTKKKA